LELRVPDSTSSNYFAALQSLAAQSCKLKPRHPTAVLLFRLGVFYQTFGEDAELLAQIAGIPLKFITEGLPVAEIPVLDCDTAIDALVGRGHEIIIFYERFPP
jgi:DNA mismatch repair protein MutS